MNKTNKSMDVEFPPLLEVTLWNIAVNGLNVRDGLEVKMFAEEAKEFKDALTDFMTHPNITYLTEIVDAVCDMTFVHEGTKSKFNGLTDVDYKHLDIDEVWATIKRNADIMDWQSKSLMDAIDKMYNCLYAVGIDAPDRVYSACFAAVVGANNQKLKAGKDEHGKAKKPEGFIPPQDVIRGILETVLAQIEEAKATPEPEAHKITSASANSEE